MARLVPESPVFQSSAERDAWNAIRRSLREEDILVANLRLSDERGDHEADLVVGMPGAGIAVVEVKGGSVHHDGTQWWQSSHSESRRVDPVEQARRTRYALFDYLKRDSRWGGRRVRVAHLVAFPYSRVDADFALPDCPRWMVLDCDDLARNPAGHLYDVLTNAETHRAVPTDQDVNALVEILGGRMLPQRDVLAQVTAREREVDLLTSQQATILGALRLLHRVEIRGGAGSGKTWLALEQARRLAQEGQRVALTCYNRGLAAFLARRVSKLPRRQQPAYVGTFHDLGVRWGAPTGAEDDSDYYERRLPEAMTGLARALAVGHRFDSLVVDEAQDFADSWWEPLLAALKDEDAGGVYVFADEGQHVFARQGRPPVNLVPIVLDENLRNTQPIAETFSALAPIRLRLRGGDGPPVRFVGCVTDDAVSTADDQVDALLDEGWLPEHLALLTTGHRHPEQVERQARGQYAYWDSFLDADQVFYAHALGFKGLERPAVVLAVNGFRDLDRAREMLYVALSRPRDLLIVCGDHDLIRQAGGESVARRITGVDGS